MEVQNGVKPYSLDDFFRVQGEFDLPDGKKIYLRSLSDNEQSIRRQAANLASRDKRLEFRDEESSAFIRFIAPLEYAADEDLIETILELSKRELQRDALLEFPQRHIPNPDDAELNEIHETLDKREAHWQEIIKQRQKYIEARSKELEKKLRDKWTREQKIARCRELTVENHSGAAFFDEFFDQLILLGSYKDEKRTKPWFASIEEVRELNPKIKAPLLAEIQRLNEVDVFALQDFSSTAS